MLYTIVRTVTDQVNLQAALDRLANWSRDWLLAISPTECAILLVNKNKRNISITAYIIGDETLPTLHTMKDLGIIVDPSVKFSAHIRAIVSKTRSRSNFIFKCFSSRSRYTDLYFICSADFGICLSCVVDIVHQWHQTNWICSKKFMTRLNGLRTLPYKSTLKELKHESLELDIWVQSPLWSRSVRRQITHHCFHLRQLHRDKERGREL